MPRLLNLLRHLFEYFGIPTDWLIPVCESYTNSRSIVRMIGTHLPSNPFSRMDFQFIPVWEFKEYGCTRSVVRMIGAVLPLDPCPRPCFQRVVRPSAAGCDDNETLRSPAVPSLYDVAWVINDGESYATFRQIPCSQPVGMPALSVFPEGKARAGGCLPQNDETIWKIAALEDELNRLRAQIAVIVAAQEPRNSSAAASLFNSPGNVLSLPMLTSTPLSAPLHQLATAPPPPPPPPPLPPPVPPANADYSNSVINLIKQRRAASGSHHATSNAVKQNAESMPSMMDVLKDMNKIQLRAVERSPGGTPITKQGKKRNSLSDPAALIAHALKQKFAHRKNDDSFGKENKSFEDSPFSSPETPLFGRHLLKPSGKRPPLTGAVKETHVSTVKCPAHI